MDRVKTIIHQYQQIIFIDFSKLTSYNLPEIQKVVEEAKNVIRGNPLNSVLTLTDFEGMFFNKEILDLMLLYVADNKPYVKASAIIGAGGLRKIAVNSAEKFSMRDLHLFETQQEALDWLIAQ
jgi:hypothetical protein